MNDVVTGIEDDLEIDTSNDAVCVSRGVADAVSAVVSVSVADSVVLLVSVYWSECVGEAVADAEASTVSVLESVGDSSESVTDGVDDRPGVCDGVKVLVGTVSLGVVVFVRL